jgi:chemotaxis protein CheC
MPILIDIRKLKIINQLIKDGAENVASALEMMAGVEATVDIKSLSFVAPEDIPAQMGEGQIYGANIELREPPYGVFLMTFPPGTGEEIAELMTGMPVEDEFTDMQQSALQEMCNVMTSGFIDGIANTLDTTIDMETPRLELADTETIADQTLRHIRTDALSIVLDSLVDISDHDTALQLRIFLVPDPGAFVNVIDKIDLDEVGAGEGYTEAESQKLGDKKRDVAVGANLEDLDLGDDSEEEQAEEDHGDFADDATADPEDYF